MNDVSDRFATWDAAYVLGALAPGERRAYEEHLAGCPACQAAVAELAGLPGLLAQVPPEDALAFAPPGAPVDLLDQGPPPADLLERVRARSGVRPARRRLVGVLVGAAAGLLLVLAGIAYAVGLLPFGASNDPRRLAFASVGPSGLTAVVDVLPVADGTDINVECVYGEVGAPRPGGAYADYSIYVVDRGGRAELVKQWPAKPNKTMRPKAHTDLRIGQIGLVEIRDTATDETLLRAYLR